MKKILFLSTILIAALTSCKKEDSKNDSAQSPAAIGTVSNWKSVEWASADSSYEATISDDKISSDVVNNGLVLAYAKSSDNRELLPAQIGKGYFYYQVENGSLQIHTKSSVPANNLAFSYILFSKDELASLAQKGVTTLQLMKMDYAQITQLKN